jgi:uncharacterized protein YegP (UPF0339 family)
VVPETSTTHASVSEICRFAVARSRVRVRNSAKRAPGQVPRNGYSDTDFYCHPAPNIRRGKAAVMAAKFEIYEGARGELRFRLRAGNGEIVATSESYPTKDGAKKGVEAVKTGSGSSRHC